MTITRQPLTNAHGVEHAERVTWDIQGTLHSDPALGQSGLTAKISTLRSAYLDDGKDLWLLTDEGALTAHALLSAQCLGGTRIVHGPSFPIGDGVEYATRRRYRISIEGDVPSRHVLLEWTERISWSGTLGPRYVWLQLMTEPPQKQQVARYGTLKAVQAGRAAANRAFVVPPEPIWPGALMPDRTRITQAVRPDNSGIRDTEWSYEFESSGTLFGLPHTKSINS